MIQVQSKNAEEESGMSEKQEEESQMPRGVACTTCGCTGECQQHRAEEFNKINHIPGPATGAIPKTSGRSSSKGQENKEKKGRRRKRRPQQVEEVEHLQLQRDLKIEKFNKDLLSLQVDLVTEQQEV